jgi:putative ABC transport system substrate-binding protein
MRRREFLGVFGGATVWPLTVRAQQPAMPVIGFIHSASPEPFARMVAALQKGLNDSRYVEDHNISFEFRWARGQFDRLPVLAGASLLSRRG